MFLWDLCSLVFPHLSRDSDLFDASVRKKKKKVENQLLNIYLKTLEQTQV